MDQKGRVGFMDSLISMRWRNKAFKGSELDRCAKMVYGLYYFMMVIRIFSQNSTYVIKAFNFGLVA